MGALVRRHSEVISFVSSSERTGTLQLLFTIKVGLGPSFAG